MREALNSWNIAPLEFEVNLQSVHAKQRDPKWLLVKHQNNPIRIKMETSVF